MISTYLGFLFVTGVDFFSILILAGDCEGLFFPETGLPDSNLTFLTLTGVEDKDFIFFFEGGGVSKKGLLLSTFLALCFICLVLMAWVSPRLVLILGTGFTP